MRSHRPVPENRHIPLWLPVTILILAILGFADAGYLTFEHIIGGIPVCTVLEGCEVVLTSSYSELFGIPTAAFGSLYYLSMAALMVAWFDTKKTRVLKFAALYSWIGLLVSAWFVYIQFSVLNAICVYCIGSAATSTLIFVFGQLVLYFDRSMNRGGAQTSAADNGTENT